MWAVYIRPLPSDTSISLRGGGRLYTSRGAVNPLSQTDGDLGPKGPFYHTYRPANELARFLCATRFVVHKKQY